MEQDWEDDYGDGVSWVWGDPDDADAVRHAMPPIDGPLPCCGREPNSLPIGQWMTAASERVNCPGRPGQP
mgnify:CR=1 FL=1